MIKQLVLTGLILIALVVLLGANVPPVAAGTIQNFSPPPQSLTAPDALINIVSNSSFEQDCCWEFPTTPLPAMYSTNQAKTGVRSARTGAVRAGQNRYSYSSTRQSVTIPGSATSATLVFWLWQSTTESPLKPVAKKSEFARTAAPMSSDVQYVLVLNPSGQRLATVYWNRKNTQAWNQFSFNMLPYKGQTVILQFGTFNDGVDGFTGMYVDDVALYIQTHPGPPSTGLVVNGTFEQDAGWEFPQTSLPASYSTANAYSGFRSARTGALTANSNVYSYSSIRQGIAIPSNTSQVTLSFALWQWTTESPLAPIPKREEFNRPEITMAGDVQYVLVLNSNNQVIATLYWNRKNTRQWTTFTADMTKYKGQTIKLQFGTFNDGAGGYTGMYVDDVVMVAAVP